MRVTRAFSRLLALEGIWVRQVQFLADRVVVSVALRRRRLVCPLCGFSTPHRHNRQRSTRAGGTRSGGLAAGAPGAAQAA